MDEKVAKLKTSAETRIFAENARRHGRPDLEAEAIKRGWELMAIEEGNDTPAKQAIAKALYAYEHEQSLLKGRKFRANRTRIMLGNHGPLQAAERMVLSNKASTGFEVLDEAGLQELSFEAIIDRFPGEFSEDAVEAARARLEGQPPPRRRSSTRTELPKLEGNKESADVFKAPDAAWKLDAEALSFLEGFKDPRSWVLARWMPNYSRTIKTMANAVSAGRPEDIFDLVWKTKDNSISEAGLGQLSYDLVDLLRDDFLRVIRDIIDDPSPETHEAIIQRFEGWKKENRGNGTHVIKFVPHLLISRAFAGIHPKLYHTTVDLASHGQVIDWFAQHTGFIPPPSTNWAARARALTAHLDRSGLFGEDILRRNLFPWFVMDQLRGQRGTVAPGHVERATSAFADLPAERREIELRHNRLQTVLYKMLVAQYGEKFVWTEHATGTGGLADALVMRPDTRYQLYEIKISSTASDAVRQAIGQLLEYAYRGSGLEPAQLVVVGEPDLDSLTQQFLQRLGDQFNLPIEYLQVKLDDVEAS